MLIGNSMTFAQVFRLSAQPVVKEKMHSNPSVGVGVGVGGVEQCWLEAAAQGAGRLRRDQVDMKAGQRDRNVWVRQQVSVSQIPVFRWRSRSIASDSCVTRPASCC